MPSDTRENYHVPGVLLAEEGQSRFDEVYLAEEDNFKLVADKILGCCVGGHFLYCAYYRYSNISPRSTWENIGKGKRGLICTF